MYNNFNQSTFNSNIQFITSKRDRGMFKEIFICESQIYTYSFLLESSSELSGSSASSVEVKRAKRINYFLGEGKKKWKPKQELLINNVNVTELFKRFRKHSIAEVEKNGHINPLRIL
ncbi:hypothetical protein INT48_009050 [Thamnidium elegans]|uniref:Uncharacterized protein n=1 Tax=Thamnidium elegans TaxID=101142 RepID=A0A8H7SY26_9FUNG|nr:hypothetical protein INT48_009050 [Thamnidium elegans]